MEYRNPRMEEIYFIKIIPKVCKNRDEAFEIAPNIITVNEAIKKLKALGLKFAHRWDFDKEQYGINKTLLVSFGHKANDNWLRSLIVEGCFAAFEKNLEFCYQFIKDINDSIFEVRLFDLYKKELEFDINSKEDFIQKLKEHFALKYKKFVELYGAIDELVMPDYDFYELYDKKYNPRRFEKWKKPVRRGTKYTGK